MTAECAHGAETEYTTFLLVSSFVFVFSFPENEKHGFDAQDRRPLKADEQEQKKT